ncbi:MAG: N-acetylmuramoyl-L-alanine amidase, partial [Oscillospiraceae bacterium]
TVQLTQAVAAAVNGVPAIFKGQFVPSSSSSSSTTNVGKVTYYMTNGGVQSSWNSSGDLYIVGSDADFVVEVKEENVVTFAQGSAVQPYNSVLRKGATDKVVDMTNNLYQLSSGGWIRQNAVTPIAGNASVYARFNDATFSQTATRDIYNFSTTSKPAFKVTQTDQNITIKFYNTDGITSVPVADGRFFSGATVTSDNGGLVLSFDIKPNQVVWGYDISYVDGGVQLVFKEKPFIGTAEKPLSNTVVCLDPGHGGTDSGALGVQGTKGPMEKNINLATAYAVKSRLESLGAYVVMTRTDDTFINLDNRDRISRENNSDFLISIHANSIAVNKNGAEAKGVEVYYNQPNSLELAKNLFANTTANTARPQRKVFYSHYIITLGAYAPSSLLEMGFMPNPVEYDDMCSPSGMEAIAKSVSDAVVACIK